MFFRPLLEQNNDTKPLSTGEETVILKVHFQKPEGGRVIAHLHRSPWMESMIKGPPKLELPAYDREIKLGDYVEIVRNLLIDKIKSIENHHKLQNDYISSLVSLQRLSIVEYDNVKFTKAAFLFEMENFSCLVCVNIGMYNYD